MMTRRKIEIIVAIVIIVLLLIALFLIYFKPKPKVEPVVEQQPVVQVVPTVNPANVPTVAVVSASTVARTFIERFGSYSSESDFANVDDIMKLATPGYQTELQTTVAGYRRQFDEDDGYTGVSTVVITIKTVSETAEATKFLITTQREEAIGSPENTTVRYQDAEVNLIKSGNDWLVNGLIWK